MAALVNDAEKKLCTADEVVLAAWGAYWEHAGKEPRVNAPLAETFVPEHGAGSDQGTEAAGAAASRLSRSNVDGQQVGGQGDP